MPTFYTIDEEIRATEDSIRFDPRRRFHTYPIRKNTRKLRELVQAPKYPIIISRFHTSPNQSSSRKVLEVMSMRSTVYFADEARAFNS